MAAARRLLPPWLLRLGISFGVLLYAGVGVAALFYQYEEFGDFIDFDDSGFPVVFDSFK